MTAGGHGSQALERQGLDGLAASPRSFHRAALKPARQTSPAPDRTKRRALRQAALGCLRYQANGLRPGCGTPPLAALPAARHCLSIGKPPCSGDVPCHTPLPCEGRISWHVATMAATCRAKSFHAARTPRHFVSFVTNASRMRCQTGSNGACSQREQGLTSALGKNYPGGPRSRAGGASAASGHRRQAWKAVPLKGLRWPCDAAA